MSRLEFNPVISFTLWLTLAVAAACLLTWYALAARQRLDALRWRKIVALMAAAFALPLVMLLNPTWLEQIPPPAGKPVLTVAVDVTASMATEDIGGEVAMSVGMADPAKTKWPMQARIARGRDIAAQLSKQLGDRFDVRVRTFAADSRPSSLDELATLQSKGETTDLTAAIDDILANDPPQGQCLVLLSDGVHNAGPNAALRECAARAKAANAPVYALTLGGATGVRDLEVALAAAQELAFVGQKIPVDVHIRQRGDLTRKGKLSLSLDGKVVEEREVELKPDGSVTTSFQVAQDKTGLYRYEVRLAPQADEVTDLNNTASLLVSVVDRPVQVLLLEGKPYWDTKFLLRTLAADPSIALSSVVRITEGRLLEREITGSAGKAPDPAVPPKGETDKPGGEKEAGTVEDNSPDAKAAEQFLTPKFVGGGGAEPALGKSPKANAADEPMEPTPIGTGGGLGFADAKVADKPPDPATPAARPERWAIRTDAGKLLASRETLAKYQIIILGRESEVFLSDEAITQLKKWLNDGEGSLICFRGAPSAQLSQRLAGLMPVKWMPGKETRFHAKLTADGQLRRWLPAAVGDDDPLARLPSLATVMQAEAKPGLSTVLASGVGANQIMEPPVISYQGVLGKVVVVEGAGMWRWAFLAHAQEATDDTYGLLWRSLIRWLTANAGLSPTQKLALRADEVSFHTHEPITATLFVRESELAGEVPKIEIAPERAKDKNAAVKDGASEWPRTITPLPTDGAPGQFRVSLGVLPEGRYQARVVGGGDDPTTRLLFDVRGDLRERLDVAARPDLMKLVSEGSGGGVLETGDPDEVARRFQEHLSKTRPDRWLRTPAWDHWWVLAAIVVVWGLTWMARRSSGLV